VATLEIKQDVRDSAVVVVVGGDIDSVSVEALDTHLDAALKVACGLPARLVVVDLGQVTYFGSAGLNAIVGCYQAGESDGVAVRVVASTAEVIRPLQVTRLDEMISPYPTVPDALAGARGDEHG
jgi:anti-anti-sigma factor